MTDEEKEAEQKSAGATSVLGKITQAGYSSLDVSDLSEEDLAWLTFPLTSSFDTLHADLMKSELGLSGKGLKLLKLLVSFSMCIFA